MGVTYKLKEEVVQYIVEAKRENPKLGCRSLAQAASDKFQIDVSKSSVNSIVKEASLSNTVGRPKGKEAPKRKFAIPSEKKEQIFKSFSLPVTVVEKEKPPSPIKPPKVDILRSTPLPVEEKNQKPLMDKGMPLLPDSMAKEEPQEIISPEPEKLVDIPKESLQGAVLPYAGLIFLKMSLDEYLGGKPVNDWAKKFCEQSMVAEAWDAVEAFIFLKVLKIEASDAENFFNSAWGLFFRKPDNLENKIQRLLQAEFSSKLAFEYENEKEQAWLSIQKLKLNLQDNSSVILDPHGISLWPEKAGSAWETLLNNALLLLSKKIMTNVEPLILGIIYDEARQKDLFDFIAAFENIKSKAIRSVDVVGESEDLISSFTVGIKRKREFIVGLSPALKLCQEWMKTKTLALRKTFSGTFNSDVEYSELETAFLEHPLLAQEDGTFKVIPVFDKNNAQATVVLLTNKKDCSSAEIIERYLEHHPLKIKLEKNFKLSAERNVSGLKIRGFSDLADDFIFSLKEHCAQAYFSAIPSWEGLLGLEGKVQKSRNNIFVELNLKQNQAVSRLSSQISYLNCRHIISCQGQKYFLKA